MTVDAPPFGPGHAMKARPREIKARPREERAPLGLGLMAAAVFCFTCLDTSAKWLMLSGLPALQVVFARYAVHFMLSMAVFLPSEGAAALRSQRPLLQALRSLLLLSSTTLNFLALSYLPITLTTTIMFAGPIAVTLLSIPVLGERIGWRRMAAIVVGFAGVIVAMQPWGADFHPAVFLSIGALMGAAGYFVMTRLLAGIETNAVSQLWASGIAALAIAPFALPEWVWPESSTGYVVLFALGVFGVVGHSLATIAHRYADASLLAPVFYLQLVFATVAGLVVFGDLPTTSTVVGALVIICSGIYIWHRERRYGALRPTGSVEHHR